MRRTLHLLLVGVLTVTVWIPIDSAMAGWFLHHRAHVHHGVPVPFARMPVIVDCPPSGWFPPAGLGGMVVIDDRPLNAPQWGRPLEVETIHHAPQDWVVDGPHWSEPACCGEEISTAMETDWNGQWSEESLPQACACQTCGDDTAADQFPADAGEPGSCCDADAQTVEGVTTQYFTEATPESVAPTPVEPDDLIMTPGPAAGSAVVKAPLNLPPQPTPIAATPATPPEPAPVSSIIRQPEVTAAVIPAEEDTVTAPPTLLEAESDVAAAGEPAVGEPAAAANLFDTIVPEDQPGVTADDLQTDLEPNREQDLETEPFPGALPDLVEEGVLEEFPAAEPALEDPAIPGDEQPAETPAASPESDPFGAILPTPAEPLRHWRDNTGRHDTLGTLVEVHPDRIRILKTNGRHTTVSRQRLSTLDRDYVLGAATTAAAKRSLGTQTAGL